MKIAFVYDVIYPYVKGGVEKRIRELAVRLAERGHEVHVIGRKYWEGPATMREDGVIFHGISPAGPLYRNGRRTIRSSLRFSLSLIPFLMREKFDIVDCQQFPYFPGFVVAAASAGRREPALMTWHEVWGEYWYEYLGRPAGAFGKAAERLAARLPLPAVSVSRTTRKKLEDIRHRSGGVVLIPNGIDVARFRTIVPAPEGTDLLFAGRLIREKHVDLLVDAFCRVAPDHKDIRLVIIGDGPERERIHEQIQHSGEPGLRIRLVPFTDSHDDVIAMMKAARIFVIPSTREGFGIAALEALACGLPVVTVDHPDNAIQELITPETGFVAPLSAGGIAEKIGEALRQSPSMGPACTAFAQGYDWNRIADMLEDEFIMLTEQGSSRRETSLPLS